MKSTIQSALTWLVRRSGLAGAIWIAQRQIAIEQLRSQIRSVDATFHPGAEVKNSGRQGAITIGRHTHIAGQLMVFPSGGVIDIGEFCSIGPSSRIWSQDKIVIGHHVLISHAVTILDTDGHEAASQARLYETEHILQFGLPPEKGGVQTSPVYIGNDVWIGCNTVILKGVSIGERTIVGAGSVVTKSLPPDCIACGNPAHIISNVVMNA